MRIYTTFAVALLCSAALSAQSTMDKDKGAMGKDTMAKDAAMTTVTGCVAQGADETHFKLTNAMSSTMPMGTTGADSATKADSAMKSDSGMKAGGMTYALDGGTNLKAHLGHKIEVTGTMAKGAMAGHDKMAKSGTMDKDKMGTMDHDKMAKPGSMDKMGSMDDKAMMGGTLKVKSVKMLSSSCM